jgi:serine/threonine-protein kinase
MLAPGNRFVLMDFGIFLSEREAVQPTVTGSPQYMAPETITGQVARGAVYLVDIYAFGVLAYELITGDVPYTDSSVPKLLQQHMIAPVPSAGSRRPNVPARLTSLVMELMAKDPQARPQSMDEVAGELRKILKPPERTSLGPMRIA